MNRALSSIEVMQIVAALRAMNTSAAEALADDVLNARRVELVDAGIRKGRAPR